MKTDESQESRAEDKLRWRYQDKEYNESFKEWRKENRDSVGFYYAENPDRFTYQDRTGFINDYPEAHEVKAFRKMLMMLGMVLIYRVTVDIFFGYLLPPVMEKMGMDIHYNLFTGERGGSEALIMILDIASQVLGRAVPAALLVRQLRIPFPVMMPMRVTNRRMFRFSVPAALLAAGVCSVLCLFWFTLLSAFGIDTSMEDMLPGDAGGLVYVIAVQILIVPVMSEICTHGVIMQFVRQFGDGTALIFSSLIIAASCYDIRLFPFTAVVSFVIGYFIIRTGSVLTGMIMRVTVSAYCCVLCWLYYGTDPSYSRILTEAFLFLTIVIGLAASIRFFYYHSDSFAMTIRPSYMSFGRKVLEAATSVPVVIWFTLTFIVTAFNISFIA